MMDGERVFGTITGELVEGIAISNMGVVGRFGILVTQVLDLGPYHSVDDTRSYVRPGHTYIPDNNKLISYKDIK